MSNFENWTEITKGLYRYVIGANVCYEIHILYHNKKRDILRANASLFVVGDWYDKTGKSFFERDAITVYAILYATRTNMVGRIAIISKTNPCALSFRVQSVTRCIGLITNE